MHSSWLFWIIFNVFVLAMLALDLGVFQRGKHTVTFRAALGWTVVWVGLAGIFAALIFWFGDVMVGSNARPNSELSLEFITGYVIEQSLSVDNLFIFLLIFRYFHVPRGLQHNVLFWGVIGALIMRFFFILAGVGLLNRFHWIVYVFGAILIYSGIRLLRQHGAEVHPEKNPLLRAFRKMFRVTENFEGDKFFVKRDAMTWATPLALVLIVVETTDVLFAVDSIPAVLAVTREPFIVYTSNVFAILGLRSLFFVLSGMMETFHLLHYGLSVILIFIGAKMISAKWYEMPTPVALVVVAAVLLASVVLSLVFPKHVKT
jgi:tellurite resistance protein TerC